MNSLGRGNNMKLVYEQLPMVITGEGRIQKAAMTIYHESEKKEAHALGRLFAAAPDLLAASVKTVQGIEQLCAMVNSYALQLGIMTGDKLKVRAEDFREHLDLAIAKARGEG